MIYIPWLSDKLFPYIITSKSLDDIRKRSKILIIDDTPIYYMKFLKKDFYSNIEQWQKIKDLNKLESGYYDVILLDIKGVGQTQFEAEQGFGLLKHLKLKNSAQIIIAISNHEWSLKYQEFFEMADAKLFTGSDYGVFKRTIEEQLKKCFSYDHYIQSIEKIAIQNDIDVSKIRKYTQASIWKKSTTPIKKFLSKNVDSLQVISAIVAIVDVAIKYLRAQ